MFLVSRSLELYETDTMEVFSTSTNLSPSFQTNLAIENTVPNLKLARIYMLKKNYRKKSTI